jgi:cytochrome c553
MSNRIGTSQRVAATSAAALILAIAYGVVQPPGSAQAVPKTVLDGVFTAAQAKRGGTAYGAACAMCHEGADVDGPSLNGAPFIDHWREDTLDRLFEFVKTNMPQTAPGSLSDSAYMDILAHLLESNSYPAGPRELTMDVLPTTLVVGENGPQPLPNGAIVRVVGCLAQNPSKEWVLTRAAGPARVRSGQAITAAETSTATAAPLGTQTFTLQNLGESGTALPGSGNEGQKVVIKGALSQRAGASRIHVTAATSVAAACPQ